MAKKPRKRIADLTAERVRELLHYDPQTGQFTWRVDRYLRTKLLVRAGAIAGNLDKGRGYWHLSIEGVTVTAGRVAWLILHGEWPKHKVDHRNGIRSDNRASNLREATTLQNNRNMRRPPRNTSGFKGVTYRRGGKKRWEANIGLHGRVIYLGIFGTAKEAHAAYVAAAKKYHGEFANFGDGQQAEAA